MIVIVFGLPGTGKSRLAQHLADELNAEYIGTDRIREELGLRGQYDPESKQKVYEHIGRLLEKRNGSGRDVIIDGTFHRKAVRREFEKKAGKIGEPISFVEMKAHEKTIEKRMKKERAHSDADYKVYLQVKYDFEEMEEPHLVLVSEAQTLEEMVKNAKCYMDEIGTDKDTD